MVAPQQPSFESQSSFPSSPSPEFQESRPPVSPRKLAANRRNARKSTGPRTAEGKARASRNAVSHGIYCRDVVVSGEDAHHFFMTRQSFLRALKPQDAVQLAVVDAMVASRWRLNRCTRAEATLLTERMIRSAETAADKLASLERNFRFGDFSSAALAAQCQADDLFRRWHWQWRNLKESERAALESGDALAAILSSDRDERALERLSRIEQRLHNHFHRCLRDLHVLKQRATQYADEPECPFLEEWDADDAEDADEDASRGLGVPPEHPSEATAPAQTLGQDAQATNVQNEPTAPPACASDGPADACEAPASTPAPDPDEMARLRKIADLMSRSRGQPEEFLSR